MLNTPGEWIQGALQTTDQLALLAEQLAAKAISLRTLSASTTSTNIFCPFLFLASMSSQLQAQGDSEDMHVKRLDSKRWRTDHKAANYTLSPTTSPSPEQAG